MEGTIWAQMCRYKGTISVQIYRYINSVVDPCAVDYCGFNIIPILIHLKYLVLQDKEAIGR